MAKTLTGARLAIATGAPATIDAAGFAALTWVEAAAGTVSIGAVGDTFETVTVPDLTVGRNRTLKGAVTGDVVNIALSRQRTGASGALSVAQAAFKAAAIAQGGDYSIRITERDGEITYFSGQVMNWKQTEMTTTSYAGFSFDAAINTAVVNVYPA
jgi:hypothetical protein